MRRKMMPVRHTEDGMGWGGLVPDKNEAIDRTVRHRDGTIVTQGSFNALMSVLDKLEQLEAKHKAFLFNLDNDIKRAEELRTTSRLRTMSGMCHSSHADFADGMAAGLQSVRAMLS
jgi:hypothetical protein